ncbi:DUF3298 domain-containing protein [Candidatus Nomurabacteria bacterium]|nr:DUF3298 domain-containing protein [Candidatus Nomurabacteria bacterium]
MKTLRIFLLILIIIGIGLLLTQKSWVPKLVDFIISHDTPEKEVVLKPTPKKEEANSITITSQKITEENFTGTAAVISGSSPLATKMQNYIDGVVSDFRKDANTEVPDIRAKFGKDNPTANYEIDINSKYIMGGKTESIVTDVYTFTGGAHGSTIYKVMTADQKSGKILALSDIVKKEKQTAFTNLVKKELNSWIPEGSTAPVVFAYDVNNLTFADFTNWSLDGQNMIIYFDQYSIGPGVLGATAFQIPLSKTSEFLDLNY